MLILISISFSNTNFEYNRLYLCLHGCIARFVGYTGKVSTILALYTRFPIQRGLHRPLASYEVYDVKLKFFVKAYFKFYYDYTSGRYLQKKYQWKELQLC